MSGFIAIATGDGGPVDRSLLQQMTAFLGSRGPDRQDVWCGPGAGLGHALFATTEEAVNEKSPCSLDGKVWITADCRVDAREDLFSKLEARGRRGVRNATDPELILHAYHAWGDDCVDRLLGDFAFAIWDAPRRRLFCARDHFGIKLFYYATPGLDLIVSNTLNCIRLHPGVSGLWNEAAISEFLMLGLVADPTITTFAEIQKLPAAHVMIWEAGKLTLRRYWRLPMEEPIRFRRTSDYVDRFHELTGQAVKDRVRTDRLSVQMSGGLDSTFLAATARRVSNCDIRARTVVFDSLIPCNERQYAEAAAERIGIPLDLHIAGNDRPYQGAAELAARRPEPVHRPNMQMADDFRAGLERHARVTFYGEGPDNLLAYEWKAYLRYVRARSQYGRATVDLARSFWLQKRIPLTFQYRRLPAGRSKLGQPEFPEWMQPELVHRLDLRRRWQNYWSSGDDSNGDTVHPYHPRGYRSMFIPLWNNMFAQADPGFNGRLVETRHPYLDLRVVRYLISLPVVPWCRTKLIMRLAAAGVLPDAVVKRRKTPLHHDPQEAQYRQGQFAGLEPPPLSEFSHYATRWPELDASHTQALHATLIPISLGFWWRGNSSKPLQPLVTLPSQQNNHGE